MENNSKKKITLYCIVALALLAMSTATIQDDEKDCADQMAELAACIPFVSGTAKKPTPECCEDTKKVRTAKPKCLCVLIKQSADPSMGLPINTTLALQMPSACNIDAKASDCPALLHLAPDSPDAKIFKQGADASASSGAPKMESSPTSAAASSSSSGASTGASDSTKTTTSTNGGPYKLGGSLGLTMVLVSVALAFIL